MLEMHSNATTSMQHMKRGEKQQSSEQENKTEIVNCLLWKEYEEFSLYIEFSKHCKSAQMQVTVHLAQLHPSETIGTFNWWCIYRV